MIAFLVGLTARAQRDIDFEAMLSGFGEGVSAPKEKGVDFEAMLSGMEGIDFGEVLGGMGFDFDEMMTSVAVDRTLDYMSKHYTTPGMLQDSYGYVGFARVQPSFSGSVVLPVAGALTSRFGYRPAFKRMHKGVDIKLQTGDTVRSAMDGTVTRVDNDPKGYGLFVVIRHEGNLETRYGHLSRPLVVAGTRVAAGEAIALGGSTGNSTGPHLHFETRRNGDAFDPTQMFNFSLPAQVGPGSFAYNSGTGAVQEEKVTYIVKAGDTPASIAKREGISLLTFCKLNGVGSTDVLSPGRMVRLRSSSEKLF